MNKKILIFDLDDTIIMHYNKKVNYKNIKENQFLTYHLNLCQGEKYIYTNGTYEHANTVLNNMNIINQFKKIYSRDTINTMKPDIQSAKDIQKDIINIEKSINNQYIFFDDQLINLKAAKKLGWKTIWIHKDHYLSYKYPFVDKSFSNIINALTNYLNK